MKKFFLPIVFILSCQLGFSQVRNQHHPHHQNQQNNHNYNNTCDYNNANYYPSYNNLILQLPSMPVQVWIDQNWIGNYSQKYESQLAIGRHSLVIRIAQSRRGYQVVYRDIYNGFIDVNPYSQLVGNCVNFKLPIQFSEVRLPYNYSYNNPSDYDDEGHCHQNNQSFNYFLSSVESCWFDSEKSALISQYVSSNQLSSAQIYQLIAALDYESSRLQIAKLAFAHCYDPQNYYSLFNLFSFGSSKAELSKFIGRC